MLYARWTEAARSRRNEFALSESETGRRWTFAQLHAEADKRAAPAGPVVFPQGRSAEFLFELLAAWKHGKPACPVEPDQNPPGLPALPADCAHLKLTSATTGEGRLIAFTAAQLAADPAQIVPTMGLRPDWPNLGAISLAHSYGLSNLALPLLLHGIPLILAASPLPEALRRAAAGHAALALPAVPALWRAWHEADAIPASTRLAVSAGAALPLALEQAVFERRGLKIHNFYGASECGGIAYDRAAAPRAEETCAGTPMDGVRLKTTPGGCLEVWSAAAGSGYLPGPDPMLGGGRFLTSDLAEIRDGAVYLLGRAADTINVAGRKLAPGTVETALRKHPEVKDCVVLGVPRRGDPSCQVVAAVVAAPPHVSTGGLQAFLHDHLPDWQIPRAWLRVDDLPTTPRGKISRADWRTRFSEG